MSSQIVRAESTRKTETPNAIMTTLSSPTLNGTTGMSMWLVDMEAGSSGPYHVMDSEQIWHVLTGSIQCEVNGEIHHLQPGDSICLSGGISRQFSAVDTATLIVSGNSAAMASTPEGSSPVVPPWIS